MYQQIASKKKKVSFGQLQQRQMNKVRHTSHLENGHRPWKTSDTVSGYFKRGTDMFNMRRSPGMEHNGSMNFKLYVKKLYDYDANKDCEFFKDNYKTKKAARALSEIISVRFPTSLKNNDNSDTPYIDLYNPLCMLKDMRLKFDDEQQLFVVQDSTDLLAKGTHFDTEPLPWRKDMYACIDMLETITYLIELYVPHQQRDACVATVLYHLNDIYRELRFFGDCAPEYVLTAEWQESADNIQTNILNKIASSKQLLNIPAFAQFFFHEEYTTVADVYATTDVYTWPHKQVRALYERICNSREIYTLSWEPVVPEKAKEDSDKSGTSGKGKKKEDNGDEDDDDDEDEEEEDDDDEDEGALENFSYAEGVSYLPVMDIVYQYNEMMKASDDVKREQLREQQRVRDLVAMAAPFVRDPAHVQYSDDCEGKHEMALLGELVSMGLLMAHEDAQGHPLYRTKKFHAMHKLVCDGVLRTKTISINWCKTIEDMQNFIHGVVMKHGIERCVAFSPEGHHLTPKAVARLRPLPLFNPLPNELTNEENRKHRTMCVGNHIILSFAAGFEIGAIARIVRYEPRHIYLVEIPGAVSKGCTVSLLDELAEHKPPFMTREALFPEEVPTLRALIKTCDTRAANRNLRNMKGKGVSSKTQIHFTKYNDCDLFNDHEKIHEIVNLYNSYVRGRQTKVNTHFHVVDGLNDELLTVLEKVMIEQRRKALSPEECDASLQLRIRSPIGADRDTERGIVGDDIVRPDGRLGAVSKITQLKVRTIAAKKRCSYNAGGDGSVLVNRTLRQKYAGVNTFYKTRARKKKKSKKNGKHKLQLQQIVESPYEISVYGTTFRDSYERLPEEESKGCKRCFAVDVSKSTGMEGCSTMLLWVSRELLEWDSLSEQPYERLFSTVMTCVRNCARLIVALPKYHEQTVCEGEAHFAETKWKQIRNKLIVYCDREKLKAAHMDYESLVDQTLMGTEKPVIVYDSDEEISDGEGGEGSEGTSRMKRKNEGLDNDSDNEAVEDKRLGYFALYSKKKREMDRKRKQLESHRNR